MMRMGMGTVFLWYCAAGGMLGVVFDLFRLGRRMIRHPKAAVIAEDLMFALVLFCISFYGLVTKTNGVFRWIFLFGEAAGFFVYELTISRFVLRWAEWLLRMILRLIGWIVRPFWRFICFWARKIHFLTKKLIFFAKNRFHGLAKQKQNDV